MRLRSMADAEALTDCMYDMDKPLCIVCEDPEVLERMLRNYQGRALYEGGIGEEFLERMSEKYGLIW